MSAGNPLGTDEASMTIEAGLVSAVMQAELVQSDAWLDEMSSDLGQGCGAPSQRYLVRKAMDSKYSHISTSLLFNDSTAQHVWIVVYRSVVSNIRFCLEDVRDVGSSHPTGILRKMIGSRRSVPRLPAGVSRSRALAIPPFHFIVRLKMSAIGR